MALTDILSAVGVNEEAFKEAESQEVSTFEIIPSGAYKANVTSLFTFDTEKGAKQLKVVVKLKENDKELTTFQNIVKKDGNPNAIGVATFKHIIEAFGTQSEKLTEAKENVVGYKDKVDAAVVKGMESIDIIVLVRAVHEEGAEFEDSNEIEGYLKIDGTNAKGEDMVKPYLEKIEKTPVKQKKAKGAKTNSTGSVDSSAKADLENLV